MSERGLWLRLADPMCAKDRYGVIHATTVLRVGPRRTTIDTICGKRARYLAGKAVDTEGQDVGAMVLGWPPRLKSLDADDSRCGTCFDLTKRPRPHSSSWPLEQAALSRGDDDG